MRNTGIPKTRSRHRQLVLLAAAVGAGALLAVAAMRLLDTGGKPAPQPYAPGDSIAAPTDDPAGSLPPDYPRIEFVDVAREAGIDFRHFHGTRSRQLPEDMGSGAAWADYDNDGFLDLYVAGYVKYNLDPAHVNTSTKQYDALIPASLNPATYTGERNLLYRNDGEAFTERGGEAGVDNRAGRSLSAAWCDFDNDGWIDLYVANDVSENALFLNQTDGSFADISHSAWVADYRGGMGLAVADWDADGDQDLLVTNWVNQENAFYNNMTQEYVEAGMNARGRKLRFMEIGGQMGLGRISLSYVGWGTAFLDCDNDGKQDILVVNGSTMERRDDPTRLVPMRNLLFWNKGRDDGFFEVGLVSGEVFEKKQVGRGLAVGDYDNDGDADAFVVVNGGPAQLLRNDTPAFNHWLKVRLLGRVSNRNGLNVRLRAVVGEREFNREVGATSSYYSQHALGEELFGLSTATLVDSLEIVWPSGNSDLMLQLRADQTVTVIEGETAGRAGRGR